jgi:hypothetical protein
MMLRNAAAAVPALLIAFSTLTLFASAASALDGIDLRDGIPTVAEGECPLLTQIRYPFLCSGEGAANGAHALVQVRPLDPNPSWESARQIPRMSDWTEGDGAWGPDLNQD